LILHYDDVESWCAADPFRRIAANLREIRDETGRLLGRAALRSQMQPVNSTIVAENYASAITAGSFRAHEQIHMPGMLIGRPQLASRVAAQPMAFDCPEGLSNWATSQAQLIPHLNGDVMFLTHHAALIRMLGGDTGDLPIARNAAGLQSFRSIVSNRDLPNEIVLLEASWGSNRVPEIPSNGLAVGTGRWNALFNDSFMFDPKKRARHARWDHYWMSLWGATIEAIARGWGVPLQEVLEASDIYVEPKRQDWSRAFAAFWESKPDLIRNPYSGRQTGEKARA
jgi:hypothetical protein